MASRARSTHRTYDLTVVGAGSAGFSAAIAAAGEGARVALIGYGMIGGTCVNVGCVPSKALIRAVEPLYQAKAASRFAGIQVESRLTGWNALRAQKDRLVGDLRRAKYLNLLPAYEGITYLEGEAVFSADGLTVDGEIFTRGPIVLATGSVEAQPDIPGIGSIPYLTSTAAFELPDLPKSMTVIGGGYVGTELAQVFARAGVAVTLVCRSRLLPQAEPEISRALTGYLAEEDIEILCGVTYRSIAATGNGAELIVETDGRAHAVSAESVLLAAGRRPNTDALRPKAFGIETGADGAIVVDEHMRTSRSGVYAAGDVTGRDQFVYMAAYGAKIAARNALHGNTLVYDNSAMPAVVFTDPQVGSVGLTEAAARNAGFTVETSILGLEHVPRALASHDTRGLIKLVADAANRKLVGAHILAPEGGDSIQTAAIAIKAGMTVEQLGDTIFPYLTTVEGLKLAAQTFGQDVKMLSCCAG